MSSFLFVTDLDNTLVGDDEALKVLNQRLEQHRQEYQTKIVYATGRSLYLYQQLTQEKPLLTPDGLITAVGTEIYFNPHTPTPEPEWVNILSESWDRETIVGIASQFSELVPQPESEQNPFKVSYYISEEAATVILNQLESALKESGLSTKLVYSGSQDLDILPQRGDKGLALDFLKNKWQVESQKTVACGDSGNDIALFQGEQKGIIVGNAKSELRQWYQDNQHQDLYLAQAGYAGGILEGLRHFGFLS